LVGNPEGKRPLEGLRLDEDNTKVNLKGTVMEGVDLIHVVRDRVQWLVDVNTVMNLRVP
jgi:hypothetical protein